MQSAFEDGERTQAVLVGLPQTWPLTELGELGAAMRSRVRMNVAAIVVNGTWPDPQPRLRAPSAEEDPNRIVSPMFEIVSHIGGIGAQHREDIEAWQASDAAKRCGAAAWTTLPWRCGGTRRPARGRGDAPRPRPAGAARSGGRGMRLELDEQRTRLDGVARGGADPRDATGSRGTDLVLHLHRLDDGDRLIVGDLVAGRDEQLDHAARHRRGDGGAGTPAAPWRRPAPGRARPPARCGARGARPRRRWRRRSAARRAPRTRAWARRLRPARDSSRPAPRPLRARRRPRSPGSFRRRRR